MFNRVFQEKYYCGLDIGSHEIKGAVVRVKDESNKNVVCVFKHNTYGLKDGVVDDLSEFSDCIHKLCESFRKKFDINFKEIQLGLGSGLFEIHQFRTSMSLFNGENKIISQKDVKRVNKQASLLGVKMDEQVVHNIPQEYYIDDSNSVSNPIGLSGKKLDVRSLLIKGQTINIRNIVKAVNQAGYDVGGLSLSPLAGAEVVFLDIEKEEGCILLDIGAQVSSILVFKNSNLQNVYKINCGGDTFTKAIADVLRLSFDLSAEIKTLYADVSSQDMYQDEEILVKKDSQYIPVRRNLIFQAIKPHIDKFVEDVQEHLKDKILIREIKHGITVLGGGSLLPGFIERIAEKTSFSVKLGKFRLTTRTPLQNTETFSSVVGVASTGFKKSLQYSLMKKKEGGLKKKFCSRVKDFYEDYF